MIVDTFMTIGQCASMTIEGGIITKYALATDSKDKIPVQKEFDFSEDYKPTPFASGLFASRLAQQPCAIEEYFKAHPDQKHVCMTCTCPRCVVMC